jgi:hypothetical protein
MLLVAREGKKGEMEGGAGSNREGSRRQKREEIHELTLITKTFYYICY